MAAGQPAAREAAVSFESLAELFPNLGFNVLRDVVEQVRKARPPLATCRGRAPASAQPQPGTSDQASERGCPRLPPHLQCDNNHDVALERLLAMSVDSSEGLQPSPAAVMPQTKQVRCAPPVSRLLRAAAGCLPSAEAGAHLCWPSLPCRGHQRRFATACRASARCCSPLKGRVHNPPPRHNRLCRVSLHAQPPQSHPLPQLLTPFRCYCQTILVFCTTTR
jgi:hypothetical protein